MKKEVYLFSIAKFYERAASEEGQREIRKNFARKLDRLRRYPQVRDKARLLYRAYQNAETLPTLRNEIGAALLYFISTLDAIPDFMPMAGISDDIAVLEWCYERYKQAMRKSLARGTANIILDTD